MNQDQKPSNPSRPDPPSETPDEAARANLEAARAAQQRLYDVARAALARAAACDAQAELENRRQTGGQ